MTMQEMLETIEWVTNTDLMLEKSMIKINL